MAAPHAGEAALAASLAALGVDASLQPLDCIEEEAIVVKSLVFTLSPGGEAVLVVVPLAAKVCTTKLGAALGRRRNDVRLATPEAALEATGFPVGCIPPLGHLHGPLRTLCDPALHDTPLLLGGGGSPDRQLRVSLAELLRSGALAVDVTRDDRAQPASGPPASPAAAPSPPAPSEPAAWPAAPPADEQWCELRARLSSVRRVSRVLAFASLEQLSGPHPLARERAGHQAIIGSTLASRLGAEKAARLLRSLRPGAEVRLLASPQVNPAPARGGAVDWRVAELELLSAAAAAPPPPPPPPKPKREPKYGAWVMADDGGTYWCPYSLSDEEEAAWAERHGADGDMSADERLRRLLSSVVAEPEPLVPEPLERLPRPPRRSARRKTEAAFAAAAAFASLPLFTLPSAVDVISVSIAEQLEAMAAAVLDPLSPAHAPDSGLPACVGIDAEWRPLRGQGPMPPVALLQVACRRCVWLVDTLALAGVGGSAASLPAQPGPGLRALDAFLFSALQAEHLIKLGCGLEYDLKRLIDSFPPLGFGAASAPLRPAAMLDLRAAAGAWAREAQPPPEELLERVRPGAALMGLRALTRLLLERRLDKGAQMSDWALRPLSAAQTQYAAADAFVLVALFDRMAEGGGERRVLDAAERPRSVAAYIAGQASCFGGAKRAPPAAAARPAAPRQPQVRVPLSSFSVDVDALLAQYLGCALPGQGRLHALVGPPGSEQAPPRPPPAGLRGGILVTRTATLLFMNAEPLSAARRYPNAFWRGADGALMVAWYAERPLGGELVLFARRPREPYVCLGRARAEPPLTGDARGMDELPAQVQAVAAAMQQAPAAVPKLVRLRLLDAEALGGSAAVASLLTLAQGEEGAALIA